MIRSVTLALMLATLPESAQDNGQRFVASPNGSGTGVWVVDTVTGEVKFCFPTANTSAPGGYVAVCTISTQ